MRNRSVLAFLVCSFLLGLSPLTADPMIQRGIDVFTTLADGNTYYDFAKNPIPAGFFCRGSKAFTGRVELKGVPLATGTPGELWGSDTVVERLDDAVFKADGTAVTRLQFRALSLASIAPVRTGCGAFHVYVSLAGEQRVTLMTLHRTKEGGGTFVAPLAVDARMSFIPVKPTRKAARQLELAGSFTFPARPVDWHFTSGAETKRIGSVFVDTDGDLVPDTRLRGTSNFTAGSPERLDKIITECPCSQMVCHTDPATGKLHCAMTPPPPPGCMRRICAGGGGLE